MGFLKPKTPALVAPPPPPAVEDTDATKQGYQRRLARRQGRVASVMNDSSQAQTASKTLLGA